MSNQSKSNVAMNHAVKIPAARRRPFFFPAVIGALIGGLLVLASAGEAKAQERSPQIQRAIDRGASYLLRNAVQSSPDFHRLAAYALVEAGVGADHTVVQSAVNRIKRQVENGNYTPEIRRVHIYVAGVELMLLAKIGPERYREEIEAITEYIIEQQGPAGDWDYPDRNVGDTSISQYGLLGLWAAERAGVSVPPVVWDKAAEWHVRTQLSGGGFAYHPGTTEGLERGGPSLSLTNAGAGSLLIARMFLYPGAPPFGGARGESTNEGESDSPVAGVLEEIDPFEQQAASTDGYTPQTSLRDIDNAIARALRWYGANYALSVPPNNPHKMYYFYSVERCATLANIDRYGNHRWFEEMSSRLLQRQNADGHFTPGRATGPVVSTSFAVLFLSRSTAQLLKRQPANTGLLISGRGLPEDLKNVQVEDGEVKLGELEGSLGDLVAQLEKPGSVDVLTAQKSLVEKVRFGDRQALVGQTERLKKLAEAADPEVRRTAVWALGRSGELSVAPLLLEALEDPDVDVVIEARNALCWLARRPLGFGLNANPFQGLPADATGEQRTARFEEWRESVIEKWRAWYFDVRPYEERDDMAEQEYRRSN